jgi:hypothetical protein
MLVGGNISLTATAKDAGGKTLDGKSFRWESAAPMLVKVSDTGAVLSTSPVTATVTATETVSGIRGSANIISTAPARILGSILILGSDTQVAQITTTKIIMLDTVSSTLDLRIGIVHVATSDKDDGNVLRANWPLLGAATECPSGELWGTSNADGTQSSTLWRIDPRTAVVISKATIDIGPDAAISLACESTGSLLIVGVFGGMTSVYRYTPGVGTQVVSRLTPDYILGIARSPTGVMYATVRDNFVPPSPQRLMTLNTSTGVLTRVGNQTSTAQVLSPIFRGTRLLGISGSALFEVDTQTGATRFLKIISKP